MKICKHCTFREVANNNTDFCGSWLCRILGRIEKVGECWLWTGAINKRTGYGKFQDGQRTLLVHRAAYTFFIGEIPEGSIVLHAEHAICGSRRCVNPNHLRLGTYKENQLDRKLDGTACTGRSQYNAYPRDVVEHAIQLVSDGKPKRHVARLLGVHESTVSAWVAGVSQRGNKVL